LSIARTLQKLAAYQATSADTLNYQNEATTGTTVSAALDWILASLYPNTQDSVDETADLPLVGNTLNDYRVVLDDGDGLAAGYRWEQREGEASPSWHKIHDMDWSSDAILSSLQDIAQELYVFRGGRTDLDDSGNPITGTYAGQTIYGGSASGQNLTLNANSGDGVGAESGYVQSDNTIRPTSDNALDLGTITERFRDLLLAGDITDGTDSVTVANLKDAYDHSQVSSGNPHNTGYDDLSDQLGTLTADGDVSGSVDLSTSGAKTLTITVTDDGHNHTVSTITDFAEGVYDETAAILQDTSNITWTKNDGTNQISGDVTVTTSDIDDIGGPAANKILVGNADGDTWLGSDGIIELTGDVTGSAGYNSTSNQWTIATSVDAVSIDSQEWIDYQTLTWTSTPSNPTEITCNSHGILTGENVKLTGDPALDGVHVATRIDANTFSVPVDTSGFGAGASGWLLAESTQLLYNPTNDKWEATKAHSEISHSEVSDLGNDDHAQYVNKDGRGGGQTIKGGTQASNNLTLQSTDHATRGVIEATDNLVPTTDAAYSGGWTGTDLGSSSKKWNDLYIAGELKGARAENVGALPSNSGTTVGRMVFFDGAPYWDTGAEWVAGGGGGPLAVTSKVANYTALDGDDLIICNGTFTVSLPDCAVLDTGYVYRIKNIGTGVISIDPHSTQTIDGSTLYDIVDQYHSITLCSDGLNWHII
jgi:hypothetical protein